MKTITESTVEDESLGFPSDNEVLFQSRINVMSRATGWRVPTDAVST
ncbi:hypothetical protein U8C32_28385 (plasmid) [Sinorhizobium medicae]|nr:MULTISPECIES: hypothetical protein [Sinorhizobium]MBO1965380.1 hypothetical protein [Sinorhizobium medicae]MDX0109048.1 hypothetical protein [Sinorhizobium meliloti]WQO48982.1 hypothetical protein U8C42_30120 [Sinorhizobium medicae]WQO56975.1 hypothetical protein U8C36_37320 [Sinorhizobium medicae]WQO61995.1 hypothetical protein U8C35_27560 [Sinorhizobium medicae]